MAEPKKRTLRGVYDGLKQISDEEGIDFGIDNYTYEQFAHKYGNKNSLAALHQLLSTISDEESVDFGIGSADEWLNSFNYNNAAQAVDWDSQPTAATQQPTAQQPTQRNMGTPGVVPNRFGIPTQQQPVTPMQGATPPTPQPQQSRRQYDYRPMQGGGSVQTPAAEQPAYRPQAAPKPQQPTYQQAQQQQPIYNTQAETPAAPEFRNTQKMYSDAADKAWQKAEQDTKALREANTKKIEDIYNNEHSTMLGKMAMAQTRATALPIEGMAASLKAHDMEKMANDAWGYVTDEDKEYLIDGFKREIMREAARSGGSGGTMSQEEAEKALREEAERRAKARQYQAMYDKAVAANAPKDVLDFLQRKIVEGNSLSKLAIAAARTIAGTRGDMDARAVATHDYGKGHRVADITGTVIEIATDPQTWASAGIGKAATKGVTMLAGKAIQGASTLKKANMIARALPLSQRMIGGSANFAAFEGLGNIVEQLQQGGVYNEETGRYEYSLKDVAKAAGHGVLLGGATGVVGGLVGNVGDKVFDRVASTAGKLAVRGGQTLTSIAAEGTIFAAPELISGEGDFDTWLESVELMAGFKLQHGLKALPGTMGRLMRVPESRAGFETRLRDLLQGRPDLALTNDEREELERGGYTDLSELAEAYKGIEGKLVRMGDEMPYDRFSQLMADNSISEAARAKMYYYVTGRGMVQSTVTAAEIAEHRDHEGNITDYVVKSYNKDGGVITSRTYKSKKAAEVEFGRLTRQSELNSIDMLEKLYDRLPGTDATTAKMLRDVIGRESGIDIDKVIGKEENRRTDEEKTALQEYLNTMAKECQDAWDRQHVDVNQQRLQPDWQEAYDMGYNADEQQRSDISIEREDNPNDPQAQAAWQGVEDRIRQDAADRADQRRAEGEKMAYKGKGDMQGAIRPLTINEDSSERDPETGERMKKTVYLVNGNIAIEPNGNGLSREGTDKTIYVYDPETGDTHELDPFGGAGVLSVGDVVSMEDYLADNEQQSQAEVQQEIDNATGKVNVAPNTPFVTPEGRQGIVKSVEGDNVIVQFADGEMEEASIPLADMQQYADALRRQEYEARHPQQTPAEQPQQPNTATEGQAPTAEQTTSQDGGNATEDTRTPAQRTYDDMTAKYGEKASHKVDVTLKDRKATLDSKKKALDKAQADYDDAPIGKEDKAEAVLTKAQEEYDTALADYNAWDEVRKLRDQALLAQAEQEEQQRKAELERKRAEETEAQRKQREAYEAEQARRKAEAEAAERRRQEENERLRQQEAEAAANPQPAEQPAPIEGTKGQASQLAIARQELEGDPEALAMLDETAPRTLVEVAATLLASGKNATKLLREDFKRETGYSDADVKRYPFLFAGADKGGITLARFGEMVVEAAREYGVQFEENDATAGIDAALELLGSVSSQADINGYITNSRIAEAYDYHNAALAAARARMLEAYGMTEGEYEAYMSWLEDAIEQGKSTLSDEEFNQIFDVYEQGQTTDVARGNQESTETTERPESAETDVSQNGERGNGETDAGEQPQQPAVSTAQAIAAAEAETDTNPTEGQKEAGNYKKGHVRIDGYDITIEQPKGSVRRGTDKNGRAWEQEMHNTYGYIRGTESVDGDHIDVFLSDDPTQGNVYVVDQVNEDGTFDEHKVMYGFADMESARQAYLSNYEDGWRGLGTITPVSKEEFKKWIESSHRKTKPFSEYKGVKTEGDVMVGEGITPAAGQTETWDEHVNKVMEAYDKEYAAIEKRDGERLRKEAAGYSDERLLNTYIRNAGISQIFGKGREGMRKFIGEEKNFKADKLDDVKENHLEAAPDAARQSFVQDVLRAELDRRGIEYKEDYTFAETSEAEKWYKQNVEGKDNQSEGTAVGGKEEQSGKGEKVKNEAAPKQKIDDVGEKIGGARKDLAQKMGAKINLDADTFPKMFPKFDLKKAVEQGLDPKLASSVYFLRIAAQKEYKSWLKHSTKEKALSAAKFFAAYAKQFLENGNTSTEFKDSRWTFTEYGKKHIEYNLALYEKVYEKFGNALFDLDLTGYEIKPVEKNEWSHYYRKNEQGKEEEYQPAYEARSVYSSKYYVEGELDKAIDELVNRMAESVSYKESHPYKLSHYYTPGVANSHYVGVKLGGKVVALTEKMGDKETSKYLKEHEAELQEKAKRLDEERKQSKQGGTNTKWKPELGLGGGRARVGNDYRNGKDVSAEDFRKTFGFRGVEFGNYVTQAERQRFINEAYDAMMDLAALLNVSPRALSLGGRLGFAIGARGGGNAMAHYEPDLNVINLTKSKGAGSLAHEWWHALDYYFNRMGDRRKTPATANRRAEDFNPGQRREMEDAFVSLMEKINGSDYRKRSVALDAALSKDYYTNPTELGARAFQDYVQRRLTDKGQVNDFLSSFTPEEQWNGKAETYPYPTGKDADVIDEKFDSLFGTMLEREDEQGNVMLYERADGKAARVSAKERKLRDAIVDLLRKAGIEVVTESEEGQRVLDMANGRERQHRVYHGSGADFERFDHSHMGEGEGAQSFGWGTYVTEVEGIGRTYAEAMGNKRTYKGKVVESDPYSDNAADRALFYMEQERGRNNAIKFLKQLAKEEDDETTKNEYLETIYVLRDEANWKESDRILYTVEVPEDNGSNFLEWDKKASDKQTEAIKNALMQNEAFRTNLKNEYDSRNEWTDKPPFEEWLENVASVTSMYGKENGKRLYNELSNMMGSEQAASEFLHSAGFVGIKYPADYYNGGRADNAKNYVIFDEGDLQITDKVKFFRTESGEAYGFTMDGKIYLDPKIATAETPIHEYTHLWAAALRAANPKAWEQLKSELAKDTELMAYVRRLYPELDNGQDARTPSDELMDEVFAHFSGRRGAERLRAEQERMEGETRSIVGKAKVIAMFENLRNALKRFWNAARELFAGKSVKNESAEDFADMVLGDLLGGFNPDRVDSFNKRNADIRYQRGGETFEERQRRAVAEKGIVAPGLNGREVTMVEGEKDHGFKTFDEARNWAKKNIARTYDNEETGGKGNVRISNTAIDKFLSESSVRQSEDRDIHMSVLKVLPEVIREGVDAEQHPDYKKGKDGIRKTDNGYNDNVLIHRVYGAVSIDGNTYRVKVTLKEEGRNEDPTKAYSYEATKIELMDGQSGSPESLPRNSNNSISAAKLLKNIEKSYDKGKKLLDESSSGLEDSDVRFRGEEEPVFYSNAMRAVENIKQERATPEQWVKMIEKQGGLKAGEDKWLGLSEWLKGSDAKTLTKGEVLDYIHANEIQIEEVEYGDYANDADFELLKQEYDQWLHDEGYDYAQERLIERFGDDATIAFTDVGGELEIADSEAAAALLGKEMPINETRLSYTTEGLDNKREIVLTVPTIEPWNEYDEIHFGEAGGGRAVAWARFGDTTDADGKRVLVIDEIQSNRHQKGREKGYQNKGVIEEYNHRGDILTKWRKHFKDKYDIEPWRSDEDIIKRLDEYEKEDFIYIKRKYEEAREKYRALGSVPDAPFDKNWHEVAMKRMLRFAAENGYDKVAWTKGEQQAERYNLGQAVEKIQAAIDADGNRVVIVKIKDGGRITVEHDDEGNITKMNGVENNEGAFVKNLTELVGKEMAVDILSIREPGTKNMKTYEGDGLRIGGEGMKGFYDQILPRFMDKYGKKWGVKTGEVELPNIGDNGLTMWSVDVTDDMRESVMRGQPLFRKSTELFEQYPTWLSGQTTSTGQHTTQITSTVKTYQRIGDWMQSQGMAGAKVLDASSGLGAGTQALRDMGFDVEDVEPYPSENREAPTYTRYEDVNGKYDVVISNAVLNVIPDDWRADVLRSMADKVKEGGKLIINVRDAKSIESQKQKIELDSPSEILVTDSKGNIRAYQKGFTKSELKAYVESELGEGWQVEIANEGNSGVKSGTAVVVTRGEGAEVPNYRKPADMMREGGEDAAQGDWYDRGSVEQIGEFAGYTPKQIAKMNARQEQTARNKFRDAAEKLHLSDNITFADSIDDVPGLTDKQRREWRRKKGWYSPRTGKIVIILGNHKSMDDVMKSILHEGVAHHGLRQMFGEYFNTFLDNVYRTASPEIRERIYAMAKKHGWDFRTATEEYLAMLAEDTDFERPENQSWWKQVKEWFIDLLHKIGFKLHDAYDTITDNELRYILWRSYENLVNPGRYNSVVEEAKDIAKQYELKVGQWDETWTIAAEEEPNATIEYGGRRIPIWATNGRRGNRADRVERNDRLSLADFEKNMRAYQLGEHDTKAPNESIIHNNAYWRSVHYLEDEKVTLADAKAIAERVADEILTSTDSVRLEELQGMYDALMPWIEHREEEEREMAADGVAEDGVRFRDGEDEESDSEERESIEQLANNMSIGTSARFAAIAARNAQESHDNAEALAAALNFTSQNLAEIVKATKAQKKFDKATVKQVTDMARVMVSAGYLDSMGRADVKGLLKAIRESTGETDNTDNVNRIIDIMVKNQLKNQENTLATLLKIKGSRVDARGINVQGKLDPNGQQVIKSFKDNMKEQRETIESRIADAEERMTSEDKAIADAAYNEKVGLQLALDYVEKIGQSKADEKDIEAKKRAELSKVYDYTRVVDVDEQGNALFKKDGTERTHEVRHVRAEYKGKISDEKKAERERVEQTAAAMDDAIRHMRMERIDAYTDFIAQVAGNMKESMRKLEERREAEKRRIEEIHHNANSDMEGRPASEHRSDTGGVLNWINNTAGGTLFAPLASFGEMLRMFGRKSPNGEGYLFNRFMRGLIDARHKELNGVHDKYSELDKKAQAVFGGKVETWADMMNEVRKGENIAVEWFDGKEKKPHTLHQGNLMYIYMVNKMSDGRMKLRHMGIDEKAMAVIESKLDPRLKEIADWLQEDFLVRSRNEYNETHKRLFGASMAAIEDYFKLVINPGSRNKDAEKEDAAENNPNTITTATGSIKRRTVNVVDLDLLNADAMHVILDHIAEMEHWNAFAEYNRDLNTLRSYKRFENQVKNMTTILGDGEQTWKAFNKTAQIAVGSYQKAQSDLDAKSLEFASKVTAAKVAFRINTALKQLLSLPAYLPYANASGFYHALANDLGNGTAPWKWCMENLPMYRERWESRVSGDPRLLKLTNDWKSQRATRLQKISRAGMLPNAAVDALTVSIGAHAVYETRKAQYLKEGYSEAAAEKRAIQDAEIAYNETQQSSEGGFVSVMQVDKSWLNVLFTIFRNASMAYQRQLHGALRNLINMRTKARREQAKEFLAKQIARDGVNEAQARLAAEQRFNRAMRKNWIAVATFGYIVQFAWNFGGQMWYLLFGDDDDKKKKTWKDILIHSLFGGVEGLTGGDWLSELGRQIATGDRNPQSLNKDMPLTSDMFNIIEKFGQGREWEAVSDIINLAVQAGVGANPQTLTDAVVATIDACNGDLGLAREAGLWAMRVIQVPQSQTEQIYFDEIGMTGEEARKLSYEQLVERYAKYRVKRNFFWTPWEWDNEKALEKGEKRGERIVKERMETMSDEQLEEALSNLFESSGEKGKKLSFNQYAKREGLKGYDYSDVTKNDGAKYYMNIATWRDIAEDITLHQETKRLEDEIKRLKKLGVRENEAVYGQTDDRLKDLNKAKKEIGEMKKEMVDANGNPMSEEIINSRMESIRKARRRVLYPEQAANPTDNVEE